MANLNLDTLKNLSVQEQEEVLKILQEYNIQGLSETYNNLKYDDYKEIPVTIDTFLHDNEYLGQALTDEEGRFTIYPYWEKVLKEIFPTNIDTDYNTAVFTGAIGLGKSTIAVIAVLYQLYRMMCLKNPYTHYGIQEIDTITFAFLNITKDAASGVAWNKCQNMVKMSPWFMERGTLSKADVPEWRPSPDPHIELMFGSKPSHIIGRAVFACLDGDTIVSTIDGNYKIKELVDKNIVVNCVDNCGNTVQSNICTVCPTRCSNEYVEIVLDDNTVIKCTPEHRLMLKDGTYKEAQYLTEDDELFDVNNCGTAGCKPFPLNS